MFPESNHSTLLVMTDITGNPINDNMKSIAVDTSYDEAMFKDEIKPLLSLLDDTDHTVTTAVQNKLLSYGNRIVPHLYELINSELDIEILNNPVIENARAVIRGLQTGALSQFMDSILDAYSEKGDIDIETAAFQLAQFGNPEVDIALYKQKLDTLALRISGLYLNMKNHTELNLLMSLNAVFFEQEDFRGATKNYYAPENSYITTLIDSKRGIPISLSLVYMFIAERVGITLHGIGMPLHFLVYHPELNVFIDTFNHGAFISQRDCEQFIKQSGFTYSDTMLRQSTNVNIVSRMMRNLIYAHSKYNQTWEAETLQETLDEVLRLSGEK